LKTDSAIKLVDRVGSKQSMMGARSRLGSLTAELEQAQRELRDMERLRIENNTLKQENQVLRDMMHKSEWERRERDRLEEAARQRMH
jgi:Tfp pilus assembly protein PilN